MSSPANNDDEELNNTDNELDVKDVVYVVKSCGEPIEVTDNCDDAVECMHFYKDAVVGEYHNITEVIALKNVIKELTHELGFFQKYFASTNKDVVKEVEDIIRKAQEMIR